jgi:trehalose 6-phosphate phosphatase
MDDARAQRLPLAWGHGHWLFEQVDAVIFDMDGVVTDTAAVHAAAWKQLFDDYLRSRSQRYGERFVPFDLDSDYRRHVDGKPRYDGVRHFLASRGIELEEGDPSDPPERESVCGLGNRKNEAFLERLRADGARPYDTTVDLIRQLMDDGLPVAVISASKNVAQVLATAGLSGLFDAQVDGIEAARLGLPGKPDPAVFLEAARRLGVTPSRAAVVEDALAGVEAGRRGGFHLVVGVDRTGHPGALRAAGADLVVSDLGELHRPAAPGRSRGPRSIRQLPSALGDQAAFRERLGSREPALFLDYDGTLSPIVAHPSLATLPAETHDALTRLVGRVPLAIISGRQLDDVASMVGISGIWYAGSHGFEIASPSGERYVRAPRSSAALSKAAEELAGPVAAVPGAWVERKAFATAVHVRQAPQDRVPEIRAAVEQIAAGHPDLRMTGGKQVFELRPAASWDKGRAVLRLLTVMDLDPGSVAPVYVGDDLTDEDAFRDVEDQGVGIVVRGEADDRPTWASFSLAGPEDVPTLLARFLDSAEILR